MPLASLGNTKMNVKVTRRSFVKSTLVASGMIIGKVTRGFPTVVNSKIFGANNTIGVGVIGCGSQGRQLTQLLLTQPDVRVIALCDVLERSIEKTLAKMGSRRKNIDVYGDFRYVLERADIDGVIISSPNSYHASPFISACQANKDVYIESPLSDSVGQGVEMVLAAVKNRRVVQAGTYLRSAPHVCSAVDLIRKGGLGVVTRVHGWSAESYIAALARSNQRMNNRSLSQDHNDTLFGARRVHFLDIVQWAMNVSSPIAAMTTRIPGAELNQTIQTFYDYPGFSFTYALANSNKGDDRLMFHGTDASLMLSAEHFVTFRGRRSPTEYCPVGSSTLRTRLMDASEKHIRNFLDCVRSRQTPAANILNAHSATFAAELSRLSWERGRKVMWNSSGEISLENCNADRLAHSFNL